MPRRSPFPAFQPHRWLHSPHLQTLAAVYLPGSKQAYSARPHPVPVSEGDQIVLHDDCPLTWQQGDRAVILVPGLGGCHRSGYMQRIAAKLNARGVRTFRMDPRGWGAAFRLARQPFHGARFADLESALAQVENCCPNSPLSVVGFSLGGNIALNVCRRRQSSAGASVDSVVAVCPPLDTHRCVRQMARQSGGLYDRHFVRVLLRHLRRAGLGSSPIVFPHRPRSLLEFDTLFTAPSAGFGDVESYYRAVSALEALTQMRQPTLLLRAEDDPLAICDDLKPGQWAENVQCETTSHGGHMGFIGRAGTDPDCRWMDWRVVEWIAGQGSRGPDQSCFPAQ